MHVDFIEAAAHIRAFNYGLKMDLSREELARRAADVMVPEFVPKSGVKIQVTEGENQNEQNGADGSGTNSVWGCSLCVCSFRATEPESVGLSSGVLAHPVHMKVDADAHSPRTRTFLTQHAQTTRASTRLLPSSPRATHWWDSACPPAEFEKDDDSNHHMDF